MTLLCGLVISPTLSPIVAPKYKGLSKHKKAYWNTLLGSTCHAVISAMVATYALVFDRLSTEYIFSHSVVGRSLIQFCLGYFCVDLTFCMLDSEMRKDKLSTLHHTLAVIGAWMAVCHEGVAMYWVILPITTEFSTPFVNVLWYLMFIDYPRHSKLFIVNSLLLVITFYACRILTIPYHWIAMYHYVYWSPSENVAWPIGIQCWIMMSYLAMDVLNVTWAYRIARGCCKQIKSLK